MDKRNLGEPQHGINVDSPDNIVQTARKGAVETAGYTKAELAKMPVPNVGDKDLRTKNDFNIDARNMNETLRGNHTATVTGVSTQTTTGPVQQNNNGGATNITKEYSNSVVLGPNNNLNVGPHNSMNVGGSNSVTLGEAMVAVLGLLEVFHDIYKETGGFKVSYHGYKSSTAVTEHTTSGNCSGTTGINNQTTAVDSHTTQVKTDNHNTYLVRSNFHYHDGDFIMLG